MSDDEDFSDPAFKKARIHFGSLEERERERLADKSSHGDDAAADNDDKPEDLIDTLRNAGIDIDNTETLAMTPHLSAERHDELMADFERRKRVKSITVPTDNNAVKARLRELGHPICLFGEGPADRRDRLRELLSVFEDFLPGSTKQKDAVLIKSTEGLSQADDVWYHEGSNELKKSRLWLAKYSLPRARDRILKAKADHFESGSRQAAKLQELSKSLRSMTNFCSQIGDDRPLSYCQFSPDGNMIATASWSGLCKLWSCPDGELIRVLRGHNDRVGAIIFHPRATIDLDTNSPCMVSCSADGAVSLWSLESDTPIGNLEGHNVRVAGMAFHPSGRFLGTACFDKSWRLWDLEQQQEVLHQEGHSRECYKIAFQNDGALIASCGFDARGLLWDLRTGRNIMQLDGHLKKVTAIDFANNGYQIATGSEDQKCMIWDIRKRQAVYTIPAHTNLVSHLKFHDNFLVTSSYDNFAKIWSHPGWTPLKTMAGHEQKVTCADISADGVYLATTSFDRTFKLWGPEHLV